MVIAAIAYRQLPDQKRKIFVELLKHHPEYSKWMASKPDPLPDNDLGLYIFMKASTWPDEIRHSEDYKLYNHPNWHFLDTPLYSTGPSPNHLPSGENILDGIEQSENSLRDASKSDEVRGIYLSWLIHLIGDIHQPLHCVSMFSQSYPNGDLGGNRVSVRETNDSGVVRNLHTIWDTLFGGTAEDLGDIVVALNGISNIPNFSLADLASDTTPKEWAQQSVRIAFDTAYLSGTLPAGSRANPTSLPADYMDKARNAAYKRGAVAGFRMASTLKDLTVPPPVTPAPQEQSSTTNPFKRLFGWINEKKSWWSSPVAIVGSAVLLPLLAISVLFVLRWLDRIKIVRKSRFLSPSWFVKQATRLLLVAPGLGRSALFLGYTRRLAKADFIRQASESYFGLPAIVNGEVLNYDATGKEQHDRICGELGPQKPVLVVGKGGAGKSTLLARLTGLALSGELPESLKGFHPIHIPAGYYQENIIQAITNVLTQRDDVNITKEIVDTQLQSGQFLILLDGLSEVEEQDKARAIENVLRVAKSAEYKSCRFLLATRPLDAFPGEVSIVELQPLTKEVLFSLIPRYGLNVADEGRLKKQLQSFDDKPLEPLLFAMAIAESGREQISKTRAGLYEQYFQRLLQVKPNDKLTWKGWQDALENIADWSFLETGKRGVGLRHQDLVNRISREVEDDGLKENLVKRLNRLFRLPVKSELELVDKLSSAGLLHSERRWRFAHDTFEEFFAASRLVSLVDQNNQWPTLKEWQGKEGEFLEVIDFVAEMAEPKILDILLKLDFPVSWRERLSQAAENSTRDE